MIDARMANLSSAALTQLAERESRKGLSEDRKTARENVRSAAGRHVDAQRAAIQKQKEEADTRHAANEERSSGGFWGGLIGSIVGALAVVAGVVCLCAGVTAAVGVALIGFGAAAFGAGPGIGNALASPKATELEGSADGFADQARSLQLEASVAEKERAENENQVSEVNQRYRQALQDAQFVREKT